MLVDGIEIEWFAFDGGRCFAFRSRLPLAGRQPLFLLLQRYLPGNFSLRQGQPAGDNEIYDDYYQDEPERIDEPAGQGGSRVEEAEERRQGQEQGAAGTQCVPGPAQLAYPGIPVRFVLGRGNAVTGMQQCVDDATEYDHQDHKGESCEALAVRR